MEIPDKEMNKRDFASMEDSQAKAQIFEFLIDNGLLRVGEEEKMMTYHHDLIRILNFLNDKFKKSPCEKRKNEDDCEQNMKKLKRDN